MTRMTSIQQRRHVTPPLRQFLVGPGGHDEIEDVRITFRLVILRWERAGKSQIKEYEARRVEAGSKQKRHDLVREVEAWLAGAGSR